jgi:hypothetical protein
MNKFFGKIALGFRKMDFLILFLIPTIISVLIFRNLNAIILGTFLGLILAHLRWKWIYKRYEMEKKVNEIKRNRKKKQYESISKIYIDMLYYTYAVPSFLLYFYFLYIGKYSFLLYHTLLLLILIFIYYLKSFIK